MMISVFDTAENIVGKGGNAGYQHFLLFPQCFQKASFSESLKVGIVWKRVNVIRIKLQTSPSTSVLLSDNVSHLQAFEVRHCLNPCAKKWYTTQMFKITKINLVCKSQYMEWPPLA